MVTDHLTNILRPTLQPIRQLGLLQKFYLNDFLSIMDFRVASIVTKGGIFESKLIEELCHLTGTLKSRTTPYHPMGSGLAERFNSTIVIMLGTLEPHQKVDWKSHVGAMVHAYNCTKHDTTGYSPYFLMFGRHPRIAVDVALGRHEPECGSYYVKKLKEQLRKAYEMAETNSRNSQGD